MTPGFWLNPDLYAKFPALYADIGAPSSVVPEAHMLGVLVGCHHIWYVCHLRIHVGSVSCVHIMCATRNACVTGGRGGVVERSGINKIMQYIARNDLNASFIWRGFYYPSPGMEPDSWSGFHSHNLLSRRKPQSIDDWRHNFVNYLWCYTYILVCGQNYIKKIFMKREARA